MSRTTCNLMWVSPNTASLIISQRQGVGTAFLPSFIVGCIKPVLRVSLDRCCQ